MASGYLTGWYSRKTFENVGAEGVTVTGVLLAFTGWAEMLKTSCHVLDNMQRRLAQSPTLSTD